MFYTRKGDEGYTDLLGGRVPKYDPRPETYGTLDEATSFIGLARAMATSERTKTILIEVQRDLYTMMAELAFAVFQGHDLPAGVERSLDADATFDPDTFSFPHGTHLCAVEVDTEHRCRLDAEFAGAHHGAPRAIDRRTGHEQGRQTGRRDAVGGAGPQLKQAVQGRVRTHRLSRRPALHPTDLNP